MNFFHDIKQDKAPQFLKLLVEIAKGGFVKYEFNHTYGILEVDRVLYGPTHYPVTYCDVPGTWNIHDGDPLDAVVFSSGDIIPGCMVHGRVVGMMEMIDNGEKDSKIICVNDKDPRYKHVQTFKDLPEWELKDLKTFMEIYKYAQTGPGTVQVPGFLGPDEAYKFIDECIKAYKEKFSK
jgi:inorganic pyrophosphatase